MSTVVFYNPSAIVPNQVTQILYSAHTPDYVHLPDVLINPNLSVVSGILMKYWYVSGNDVLEMSPSDKNTIDGALLPGIKSDKKSSLAMNTENFYLSRGYSIDLRSNLQAMYTDGIRGKPKKAQYLQPLINWMHSVDTELHNKQALVDFKTTSEEVQTVSIDTASLVVTDPGVTLSGAVTTTDSTSLDSFLDVNAEVVDPYTDTTGSYYLMEILNHRRDLYNDSENPLYIPNRPAILGNNGILQDHANRVLNLETIHGKLGWHEQQVYESLYRYPKDLLIYYGWLNSFNSAQNAWTNEKVAQDMAKYSLIVLGDGIEDPSHGDYANTQIIIPRIKQLNPRARIFGYVAVAQAFGDFQVKVDWWNTLSVHGIFMDEAGYDYGQTRLQFNACVDFVHERTSANICFANAWNTDHILGTADDVSFPNSTYNSTNAVSKLISDDWILLESFLINTTAYSGASGYESKIDWLFRGQKAVNLRATYGVNFASSAVINNSNVNGEALFNFQYISSLMFSLEAVGSSDDNYAASSAAVVYWPRPDISDLNAIYSLYPSVTVSTSDADVYYRYVDSVMFLLDFSTGAQIYGITKYGESNNTTCLSTITGINGKAVAETILYTVPVGKTAIITDAVIRPIVATAVTAVPTLGIGRNGSSDDIFASTSLTGLDSTAKIYRFVSEGTYAVATSGENVKLGIDTDATATTLTLTINLFGYLI